MKAAIREDGVYVERFTARPGERVLSRAFVRDPRSGKTIYGRTTVVSARTMRWRWVISPGSRRGKALEAAPKRSEPFHGTRIDVAAGVRRAGLSRAAITTGGMFSP